MAQEDYCRYYSDLDAWAVIFPNRAALSTTEVDVIFSKFGSIKKIIQTGDSRGYCIVKFAAKENAMKCIANSDTLAPIQLRTFNQEHNKKICKHKSGNGRMTTAKNNENSTLQCDRSGYNHDTVVESNDVNKFRSEKTDKENTNGVDSAASNWSSNKIHNGENNVFKTSIHDQSIMADAKHISGKIEGNNYSNLKAEENESNIKSHHSNLAGTEPNIQLNRSGMNGTKEGMRSGDAYFPEGLPELIERKATVSKNFFPSMCDGSCCGGSIETHELIVANIHEACDVDFILNLFREYEPIFVSNMEIHEEKSFRYCHVHFETLMQAKAAEEAYDRMGIYGQDLIVLRPESVAYHI